MKDLAAQFDPIWEILVVCPSRDRPDHLAQCVKSFLTTSEHAAMVCYIDEDQRDLYGDQIPWGPRVIKQVGSRMGSVHASNFMMHLYRGPCWVYGMVPDDSEFLVPGWDTYLLDYMRQTPNKVGLMVAAHDKGEIVNFPWVTRNWIDTVGWYYYPENYHSCCDTIVEMIGECSQTITFSDPTKFKMSHLQLPTMNHDRMRDDAFGFLMWMVNERRDIVRRIRAAVAT